MPPSAVLQTLTRLWPLIESSGAPACVAGGLALSYWGNPRSTQDVDVAVSSSDLSSLRDSLTKHGFRCPKPRVTDLGLFQIEQWMFEIEEEYIEVEVDLMVSDCDYYASVLKRAKRTTIPGMPFPVDVIFHEDLLIHKLYAGRLIDHADAAMLIESYWDEMDRDRVKQWANRLGIASDLEACLQDRA